MYLYREDGYEMENNGYFDLPSNDRTIGPWVLTQNLNFRTPLKLEYNIKSLNYIQQNYRFQASFLFY